MSRQRTIGIWILLFLAYGWFVHFWPHFHTANESIRLYFVQSVVDHGSLSVDPVLAEYGGQNADRAVYRGKSYLDKAPGLSLLVMPAYWFLTRAFGMSTDFAHLPPLYHLLLLVGLVIPALLGLEWTRRLALHWTDGNERAAWAAALTLGLATPYALYATLFFGHTLVAALAIGSLYFLERERPGLAGTLAGAMVLTDTASCALALILGLYAGARRRSLEPLLWFGLGGMPFVAIQLAYNTWVFGGPLQFAYAHKASAEMAAIHDKGWFGFQRPTTEALWGLTLGAKRGLFFHAPVLLAAFLTRQRPIVWSVVLVYFLWICGFGDWPAGSSFAPRHLVPLTPFLALGVGCTLARRAEAPWIRWAFPPVLCLSIVLTWAMVATFPYAPDSLSNPLIHLAIPMLLEGHLSPQLLPGLTVAAVVPLACLIGVGLLLRLSLRTWATGAAGLLLVVVLVGASPHPTAQELGTRAFLECLTEHPETGRQLCEAADGAWIEPACRCRLP